MSKKNNLLLCFMLLFSVNFNTSQGMHNMIDNLESFIVFLAASSGILGFALGAGSASLWFYMKNKNKLKS